MGRLERRDAADQTGDRRHVRAAASSAMSTGLAGLVSSTTSKPGASWSREAPLSPSSEEANAVRIVTVKMTSENIPSSIEVRNRRASG